MLIPLLAFVLSCFVAVPISKVVNGQAVVVGYKVVPVVKGK